MVRYGLVLRLKLCIKKGVASIRVKIEDLFRVSIIARFILKEGQSLGMRSANMWVAEER
jgi:hypothetical protein